jgi:hypothetical protein
VNLVSAFSNKSKRVKKQVLLEVNIGAQLHQEVLLSAQFLTEAILGLDFLISYGTKISFPERRIMIRINEEVFNFEFTGNHWQIVSATWGCCPSIPKFNTS